MCKAFYDSTLRKFGFTKKRGDAHWRRPDGDTVLPRVDYDPARPDKMGDLLLTTRGRKKSITVRGLEETLDRALRRAYPA